MFCLLKFFRSVHIDVCDCSWLKSHGCLYPVMPAFHSLSPVSRDWVAVFICVERLLCPASVILGYPALSWSSLHLEGLGIIQLAGNDRSSSSIHNARFYSTGRKYLIRTGFRIGPLVCLKSCLAVRIFGITLVTDEAESFYARSLSSSTSGNTCCFTFLPLCTTFSSSRFLVVKIGYFVN